MPRFPLVAETSQSLSDRVFGQLVAKAKARGGTFHAQWARNGGERTRP